MQSYIIARLPNHNTNHNIFYATQKSLYFYVVYVIIMHKDRYKLDSIGYLYTAIANHQWSGIFRLSCVLYEWVDPKILQNAVDLVAQRMPYFFVSIQNGLRFPYFVPSTKPLLVAKDQNYPCQMFAMKDEHLIRVLYHHHRIAIEVFHAITDGGGAFVFLNTLIKTYLNLKGKTISTNIGCLDINIPICDNEYNDDYLSYPKKAKYHFQYPKPYAYQIQYTPKKPKYKKNSCHHQRKKNKNNDKQPINAHPNNNNDKQNTNTVLNHPYYLTHFVLDTQCLKQISQQYNATIGMVITSIVAFAIDCQRQKTTQKTTQKNNLSLQNNTKNILNSKHQKNITINTSIDLRKHLNGQSLRNNFACKLIPITNQEHSFASIVHKIKKEFATIDSQYLYEFAQNTARLDQFAKFYLPNKVKNTLIKLAYFYSGERLATISIANYGVLSLPQEFEKHIYTYESSNGVAKLARQIEASVVTFANKTTLTLCCQSKDTQIDKPIQCLLSQLNQPYFVYDSFSGNAFSPCHLDLSYDCKNQC